MLASYSLLIFSLCLSLFMLLSIDTLVYGLERRGWSRFAFTFFIFYSQIVVSEFLLGIFSTLGRFSVVITNLAISSFILFIVRKRCKKNIFRDYFRASRRAIGKLKTLPRDNPWLFTLLVLAGLFILWIIFLGLIFPVTDFDGNSYHLTFIGNMVQNHNFFDTPTSLPWLIGYPKGGEFIQAWTVLISHNDMLVDLTQLPFLALGIYALYEIAHKIGAKKTEASFAAFLFIFLPIVLNQLKTSYVDVMLTSLFFAGLAMIIQKRKLLLDYVVIGIIFSLLISVKSTGFLFLVALLPLLLFQLYKEHKTKIKLYLKPLLVTSSPLWFGFYWYIKDYIAYGSPIYPFGYKIAGIQIFPGKTFQEFAAEAVQNTALPRTCLKRIWFVWTEQKDWFGCFYNYDTNYAGLGPIWFIVLIPAVIISIYLAIKKRNSLYLLITALVGILFAIYPSNYYSRYTMFITALGIMGLSLVLSNIHKLVKNFVKALLIILAVSVLFTNLTLCNFSFGTVKDQFMSLVEGSQRGTVYNNLPGKAFVTLENQVSPGDTVVYDSEPYFIYPLWTPNFSDRVIYLPSSDKEKWFSDLHSASADYIFTVTYSKENKWAEYKFKTIYKDGMYEIFKVN